MNPAQSLSWMERQLRIEYPGAFYHVTPRGKEHKEISKSRFDREKFLLHRGSPPDPIWLKAEFMLGFFGKEAEFRSLDYRWPRDALHHWSRIWEYPYIYYHLKEHAATLGPGLDSKVVDLGSAVTFFPFSVARLGYHVHCLDIDATCGPDIERAAGAVQHQPGEVDFRLISDGLFPLKDGEVDALYCVSVLEHIPDFENTIEEVVRVLKPNGLFILTIDLDLCGYMDIGIRKYYDLRQCLVEYFDLKEPEVTVHPLDVLQPRNGPFPYMTYSTWQKRKFHVKQRIKPLFRKKPFYAFPNLAVWGAVMTKRSKM